MARRVAFASELLEPVGCRLHGTLRAELFGVTGWFVLPTEGRTGAESLAELSVLTVR